MENRGPSGWQDYLRGFAEPIVGRIVQLRRAGPDLTLPQVSERAVEVKVLERLGVAEQVDSNVGQHR